ncbi:Retroelement [Phytophthora megakarya]|uniref:Retroelement n=1 Tax=Phytophthora megakarya TaxID=4795 RepID=A0A225V597_9STRA|nr:Retroelement [Phytophthora megakarya]
MDFVTGLPVSRGFDAILVVVDLLSKRPKYVPTHTTATAAATNGLPQGIVSGRDPKFTTSMWTELMKIMGVKLRMTTSYRAQADGQVERQNRVLEDALQFMVSLLGTDWGDVLGTMEFAHSTLVNSSTKMSLFEIDTGRVVRMPIGAATTRNDYARNFVENRRRIVAQAKQNLAEVQDQQCPQYNKKRASTVFAAGAFVYLATKNLPLAHAATGTSIQKDCSNELDNLVQETMQPKTAKNMDALEKKLRHHEQNIFHLKEYIDSKSREIDYEHVRTTRPPHSRSLLK